jgi:hypothetical protein
MDGVDVALRVCVVDGVDVPARHEGGSGDVQVCNPPLPPARLAAPVLEEVGGAPTVMVRAQSAVSMALLARASRTVTVKTVHAAPSSGATGLTTSVDPTTAVVKEAVVREQPLATDVTDEVTPPVYPGVVKLKEGPNWPA